MVNDGQDFCKRQPLRQSTPAFWTVRRQPQPRIARGADNFGLSNPHATAMPFFLNGFLVQPQFSGYLAVRQVQPNEVLAQNPSAQWLINAEPEACRARHRATLAWRRLGC
jgi:hypothetical protein